MKNKKSMIMITIVVIVAVIAIISIIFLKRKQKIKWNRKDCKYESNT